MNMQKYKEEARKSYQDQQSQDNEGGVGDSIAYIQGYIDACKKYAPKENNDDNEYVGCGYVKSDFKDIEVKKEIVGYKINYAIIDLFGGTSILCETLQEVYDNFNNKKLSYHYVVPVYMRK